MFFGPSLSRSIYSVVNNDEKYRPVLTIHIITWSDNHSVIAIEAQRDEPQLWTEDEKFSSFHQLSNKVSHQYSTWNTHEDENENKITVSLKY